jgi:DNA-directed RNA polymerase specialized sigma24 family protein
VSGTGARFTVEEASMPPPRKIHVLAQEDFDRLLAWLDPDREQAGYVYENIRWRLTTIFSARNCPISEELADETIDRVARRVADLEQTYTGDKRLYFFGVANNVHHEYLKRPTLPEDAPEQIADDTDLEQIHNCLEECLERFPETDRKMILRYYSEEKKAKVDLHKQMAEQLGISINTLRLRVMRMKEKLEPCIQRCLERAD